MDLNLDTLKREILEHLAADGFAIFRSSPGAMEGLPMVLCDSERYPDFQMYLDVAQKSGARVMIFATREFDSSDLDELIAQIDECGLTREEQREYESRLRELRIFEGVTCTLEMAFDYNSRLYVYEVQPDWYEEYLSVEDEITSRIADEEDVDDSESLGGYFSKN